MIPSQFQKKTLWAALTGLSIFVLAAIVVYVIIVIGRVLGFLSPVLVPVAISGILAYLLDPLVRRLQKWGLSRLKATIAILLCFLLFITTFAVTVLPQVANDLGKLASKETRESFIENISNGLDKLESESALSPVIKWLSSDPNPVAETEAPPANTDETAPTGDATTGEDSGEESVEPANSPTTFADKWKDSRAAEWFKEHSEDIFARGFDFLKASGSTILGMVSTVIGLAMVPIFLFFFLKDSAGIQSSWHEYIPLKSSKFKTEVVETLGEINGYLIAFFRGQVLVSFIDGVLTGIALKIMGLDYAISIGLALAVLGIMPFVGIILTYIPAALIALATWGDWEHVAIVTVIFIAVQQIDGFLIQPKIVGDSVGLHPMTVIFSVLLWSLLLGGIIGALLAVPLTAALKVLLRRYIWELKIRPNLNEPPAETPAT